jgi:hypothetical protein
MIDEQMIRELVTRLSRPDRSGASVIERAAILAEGENTESIVSWILEHGGQPEAPAPAIAHGGLHAGRLQGARTDGNRSPRRYILPPGVLL